MTTALTLALAIFALVYGPLHMIALAAGLWCLRWAWMNERQAPIAGTGTKPA